MELMVCEVLCLADPYITVPSYPENHPELAVSARQCRMSECPQYMQAYWRMSEYLFKVIEFSTDAHLQPARAMIHRIRRRDLFGFAGETILTSDMMKRLLASHRAMNAGNQEEKVSFDKVVKAQLWAMISDDVLQHTAAIAQEDVFCHVIKMGYGKGNQNPLTSSTAFYSPDKAATAAGTAGSATVWKLGSLPEGIYNYIVFIFACFYVIYYVIIVIEYVKMNRCDTINIMLQRQ